ncbi:MAG: histidine phosphatase family protein, partial [Candidatus Micrarchaeota archaeon]
MRHAESERNLERERIEKENSNELTLSIKKRDPDIELTSKGIEQAAATGKALKEKFGSFDIAFVSPFKRTRQTAEIILDNMKCNCDYRIEERLREKEMGILDMYTKKGIKEKFPDEYERKQREGKYYYRPPGGESYADVGLRLYSFIGSMMRSGSGKNCLVVAHSVVVKMFRKNIEKML